MAMVEYIAKLISDKATQVAEEEVGRYRQEYPEIQVGDDIKTTVVQRSISQLTFQMNHFRAPETLTEEQVQELFEDWYKKNEQENLKNLCYRCVNDEVEKLRDDDDDSNLTFLEKYLKDHKRKGLNVNRDKK